MLSDRNKSVTRPGLTLLRLNAPYGARRFLTRPALVATQTRLNGLNAPYGARCFLIVRYHGRVDLTRSSLNAPYGARCFLTPL